MPRDHRNDSAFRGKILQIPHNLKRGVWKWHRLITRSIRTDHILQQCQIAMNRLVSTDTQSQCLSYLTYISHFRVIHRNFNKFIISNEYIHYLAKSDMENKWLQLYSCYNLRLSASFKNAWSSTWCIRGSNFKSRCQRDSISCSFVLWNLDPADQHRYESCRPTAQSKRMWNIEDGCHSLQSENDVDVRVCPPFRFWRVDRSLPSPMHLRS